MLGLADRARVIDLFEQVMRGDWRRLRTLEELRATIPAASRGQILVDLADFVHLVTRLKLVPEAADDPAAHAGRAGPRQACSPKAVAWPC